MNGGTAKDIFQELRRLISDSSALVEAIAKYPGLAWVKRYDPGLSQYIMVALSQEYVDRILGGRIEDYLGKTDFDVWPYDVAKVFYENDDATRRAVRDPHERLDEPWESSRTGNKGVFRGRKFAFSASGYVYVAGFE